MRSLAWFRLQGLERRENRLSRLLRCCLGCGGPAFGAQPPFLSLATGNLFVRRFYDVGSNPIGYGCASPKTLMSTRMTKLGPFRNRAPNITAQVIRSAFFGPTALLYRSG